MQFIKVKNYRKDTNALPCPFCGEIEEIYLQEYEHAAGIRWRIVCARCLCQIDRGYDQNPSILVEIWNKRK